MKKVIGIGGVFFKSSNPDKLKEWYKENLGFDIDPYGTIFQWNDSDNNTNNNYTIWSPFSSETKYFEPSEKEFMINFVVSDIQSLVTELKSAGVSILDEIATYEYGKFVHIMDIDGNKLELWEPSK
ncbi:MAG: VOC family protein [Saprospiraceae bacterium]